MPVLYYVRHGLTDWNVEQRLQGRRDIPLNQHGRSQAMRCGDILRDLFARDGRAPEDFSYAHSGTRDHGADALGARAASCTL